MGILPPVKCTIIISGKIQPIISIMVIRVFFFNHHLDNPHIFPEYVGKFANTIPFHSHIFPFHQRPPREPGIRCCYTDAMHLGQEPLGMVFNLAAASLEGSTWMSQEVRING